MIYWKYKLNKSSEEHEGIDILWLKLKISGLKKILETYLIN
jgi:hypothetical protein